MTCNPPLRLAVLGLGNTLLGDDAIGPHVAERVAAAYELPDSVEVLDLGTPGLDLTPYLLDVDAVLFVDAVDYDAPPGSVRLFLRASMFESRLDARVSPHDPGVQQALQIVELSQGRTIDAAVLGVQPLGVELGAPLSPVVSDAIPDLEAAVIDWLKAHHVQPRLRVERKETP